MVVVEVVEGGEVGLAVGVVAEGGAGVLEGDGVPRVAGGEGVAGRDGVLHECLAFLASCHRFLVVYLRLRATHFEMSKWGSVSEGKIEAWRLVEGGKKREGVSVAHEGGVSLGA